LSQELKKKSNFRIYVDPYGNKVVTPIHLNQSAFTGETEWARSSSIGKNRKVMKRAVSQQQVKRSPSFLSSSDDESVDLSQSLEPSPEK
jgi:hypothetical protein